MSQAEYMREYRARRPATQERQTKLERAKRKAKDELAKRHPDEYATLLRQMKAEEGL